MDVVGNLIDMELRDESKLDTAIQVGGERRVPDYPWGLRLSFEGESLTKTGLAEDISEGRISVGDTLHIRCFARVTSISDHETAGGRLEAQITHIFEPIEDETTEGGDDDD